MDGERKRSHDAHQGNSSYAYAISRLSDQDVRYTPMGVFREVERPSYDQLVNDQLDLVGQEGSTGEDALQSLLDGSDSWSVQPA